MSKIDILHQITKKQLQFIQSDADKVLFGGAAGGGKSHIQVLDSLRFALQYPGSRQIIFRRTYRELEGSIIQTALKLYPPGIYKYSNSSHRMAFYNGSVLEFGYCATYNDVHQYQSQEFDVMRFDELTHFTREMYVYLCTRVRGTNNFPKQVKSSTNPGNVGHDFVKSMFVDPAPPGEKFTAVVGKTREGKEKTETRLFIPCLLDENIFLAASDPDYEVRLMQVSEAEYQALRYGNWDIFEGRYFTEFNREYHVIKPFKIPSEWRKFRAIDYGLDALACLWIAMDYEKNIYVYRELKESDLSISVAAKKINELTPSKNEDGRAAEKIYVTLAPPDMWGRSQESGRTKADLFRDAGLSLTKSSNDREAGWLAIKELLTLRDNGKPRLFIFDNCTELIHDLPALIRDTKFPTDCMIEPHEITHVPDALRYFAIWWARPAEPAQGKKVTRWPKDMLDDYYNGTPEERAAMEAIYGKPYN
jgi:hypothetical protein